jgi:predicted dithiol-disulfide oxidoreductase (DUF899 family)
VGWTVPWYSSYGSDFNHDFEVTLEREGEPLERPGVSCFLRDGERVGSWGACGQRTHPLSR